MIKLLIKFIIYSLILWLSALLGITPDLQLTSVFILAAVLTAVNTLLRPLLVLLALPFNVLTFGIASVFANLLSLVIANAISGHPLHGFWIMLLIAFVVMLADDSHRVARGRIQRLRLNRA